MKHHIENSHKSVCKAGFYLITMLAKSRLNRVELGFAIKLLEKALGELRQLQKNLGS